MCSPRCVTRIICIFGGIELPSLLQVTFALLVDSGGVVVTLVYMCVAVGTSNVAGELQLRESEGTMLVLLVRLNGIGSGVVAPYEDCAGAVAVALLLVPLCSTKVPSVEASMAGVNRFTTCLLAKESNADISACLRASVYNILILDICFPVSLLSARNITHARTSVGDKAYYTLI
jgi:hypothetical protein